jgi:hypothetical protein
MRLEMRFNSLDEFTRQQAAKFPQIFTCLKLLILLD